MEIVKLKLVNFRNFSKINLKFSKGLNLIVGNNGSGKTNIIEAINILALTKTFRNVYENVLIKHNEQSTTICGEVKSKIINKYQIEITKDGKKAKINNNNVERLSDYISKILVVTFSSNDLKLIKDSPSTRRKIINIIISQLNNDYIKHLNEYTKLNKQRNSFLKVLYTNKTVSLEYLDILTSKLIDSGIKVYEERKRIIDLINQKIGDYYKKITNNDQLKINYKSDYSNKTKEQLLKNYQKNLEKEIILGKTIFGIHTDDIEFFLDNNNIKDFGSEGQQKNAIISLKLCEIDLIKELKKEVPILLIDDLYSELDKNKIKNILNNLDLTMQIFITVTDLNKVSKNLRQQANILRVRDGEVK
ncbi:MAG: DNA replication/repair protein RecF [Mollicutes bacterium]|nr:DNA replication/repair protein RecF [Mollicutes bacterium]